MVIAKSEIACGNCQFCEPIVDGDEENERVIYCCNIYEPNLREVWLDEHCDKYKEASLISPKEVIKTAGS